MSEQKYFKKREEFGLLYVDQLKKHILENAAQFFAKENEAESWFDFCNWSTKKTDRDHLVMPGEVCLIDRQWNGRHAYVICKVWGSVKKPRCKDLLLVCYVDELSRMDWRNGYFLLPVIKD